MQTDISCDGRDLLDYLRHEFAHAPAVTRTYPSPREVKHVPFWTDFVMDCWA